MEHLRSDADRKELGGRNVPESDILIRLEKSTRQELQKENQETEAKFPEISQKLNRWLESINQKVALQVFEEYALKSDVSIERLNGISEIYLQSQIGRAIMTYNPITNSVQINAPYFDSLLRGGVVDEVIEPEFLKSFFHELCHATGSIKVGLEVRTDSEDDSSLFVQQVGVEAYSQETISSRKDGEAETKDTLNLFKLLNEGITEQITHEVLLEYLRRSAHGTAPHIFRKISERSIVISVLEGRSDYDAARQMVMAIVEVLAHETGVSTGMVWRGLVREYYTGEMSPGDMVQLLSDTFGVEFAERLAQAKDGTDLRELALSMPNISAHYPRVRERWLEHLRITHGAK